MSKTTNVPIEQKLQHLRARVEWFEGEDFTIDEALARFEAAEQLAADIENELQAVKNKVTVLQEKFAE